MKIWGSTGSNWCFELVMTFLNTHKIWAMKPSEIGIYLVFRN